MNLAYDAKHSIPLQSRDRSLFLAPSLPPSLIHSHAYHLLIPIPLLDELLYVEKALLRVANFTVSDEKKLDV
jgi:hypothetical protein